MTPGHPGASLSLVPTCDMARVWELPPGEATGRGLSCEGHCWHCHLPEGRLIPEVGVLTPLGPHLSQLQAPKQTHQYLNRGPNRMSIQCWPSAPGLDLGRLGALSRHPLCPTGPPQQAARFTVYLDIWSCIDTTSIPSLQGN